MSTPIVLMRQQIAAAWVALTPPDRTSVTYHAAAGRASETGATGDRSFRWLLPLRSSPSGQMGATVSQVSWLMRAQLRLTQAGRSADALHDAVANETNLLARTVEMFTSLPAAVYECETLEPEPEIEDSTGDALILFQFRVLCGETDG